MKSAVVLLPVKQGIRIIRILSVTSAFAIANGTLIPFVGLVLAFNKVSAETITLIAIGYYIGWNAGSVVGSLVIHRLNPRTIIVFCSVITALSCAALVVIDANVAYWWIPRFFAGLGMGLYYVSLEGWINQVSSNTNRARAIGSYEALRIGIVLLGPYLAAILMLINFNYSTLSIAAVFLLGAFILVATNEDTKESEVKYVGIGNVNWTKPFLIGVVGCFSIGWANSVFHTLIYYYGEQINLSVLEIGFVVTIFLCGSAMSQYPSGWISDHYGRQIMMVIGSAGSILLCLLIYYSGVSGYGLNLFFHFLLGVCSGPLYAIAVSTAIDTLESDEVMSGSGITVISYGVGNVLALVAATLSITYLGARSVHLVFGFSFFCYLWFLFFMRFRDKEYCMN